MLVAAALLSTTCASRRPEPASAPSAAPTPNAAAELISQAEELYAGREDLARLRGGIGMLRRAQVSDARNYEAAWRLAKFNYYLGVHSRDAGEVETAFREGVTAGENAVRLAPQKPEGHFWLGANLGGRARTQETFGGLASVGDIRREMETVLKLDEGFQGGSAYLVLGQIELETPRLLGGDPRRAVELFEKGLRFGEDNVLLRLRLAQAYLAAKRPADARRHLDALIANKPHPDYLPEYHEAAAEAKELLKKNF